jgi:hypothetical protein
MESDSSKLVATGFRSGEQYTNKSVNCARSVRAAASVKTILIACPYLEKERRVKKKPRIAPALGNRTVSSL